MTQDEIIELACQTFGGIIKKEERKNFLAFAKLVAEKAIKEALSQPEQEPVAWEQFYPDIGKLQLTHPPQGIYYTPPQRTWVELTDDEILAVNMSTVTKLIDEPIVCDTDHNIIQLGKAIEAKLKHKNTRGQE